MSSFLADVLLGLSRASKDLPCKYLYDSMGALLFDEICELPVYYPTRTEMAILGRCSSELGVLLDSHTRLVELGSGASEKTCLLLDRASGLGRYVPVDICPSSLSRARDRLRQRYPRLKVTPLAADYTQGLTLPAEAGEQNRTVLFFPGSTIGNFEPSEAGRFLEGLAQLCGGQGALIVGVDTKKDPVILHAAYNDPTGITARFNLNLLVRINRELEADFDLNGFDHRAEYRPELGCVEMRLVSRQRQRVTVANGKEPAIFDFEAEEAIVTERSYKYTPEEFDRLALGAGFYVQKQWTDRGEMFGVYLLRCA